MPLCYQVAHMLIDLGLAILFRLSRVSGGLFALRFNLSLPFRDQGLHQHRVDLRRSWKGNGGN